MNKVHGTTSSHYYSVFLDRPGEPELAWFGHSERAAAWQFLRAIKRAEHTPGACGVDLRRDSKTLASVPITSPAIA